MPISKLRIVSYQEPIGRSMNPEQLIPALVDGLQKLIGPTRRQTSGGFKGYPTPHVITRMMAGKPFKGKAVYKLMDQLDFTPTQSPISGAFGGYRHELDGRWTAVVYCNYSGATVISSTIQELAIVEDL
jgi:hypothetical protein